MVAYPLLDNLEKAILAFAALPLPQKVEALANSVIEFDGRIEKLGRMPRYHASRRDWDYEAGILSALLGSNVSPFEWNLKPELFYCWGASGFQYLKLAGVDTAGMPKVRQELLDLPTGILASGRAFLGIVEGHEHFEHDGLCRPDASFIQTLGRVAEALCKSGAYDKSFVGNYVFVGPLCPSFKDDDRLFGGFCCTKKSIQISGATLFLYVAGVEF